MSVREYLSWTQKTILGASLKVVAPTGQYDPTRLINDGPQYETTLSKPPAHEQMRQLPDSPVPVSFNSVT